MKNKFKWNGGKPLFPAHFIPCSKEDRPCPNASAKTAATLHQGKSPAHADGKQEDGEADLDKTLLHVPNAERTATSRMPEPTHGAQAPKRKTHPKPRSIFKPRTKNRNFLLSVAASTIRLTVVLVLCASLAVIGAVVGIAKAFVDTAPTLDLAALDSQDKTSFIYDSNGNLITDYKGTEDRIMVSIDEIPVMLQNAFIAVEDARFYQHNGVDVKRIVGALITNITTGSLQGGSTITQQLIKQTVLSSESSYKRKLQEAYLAMELETRYTKEQILESYLNTIFLGGSYYGVRVAAYGYFGKELNPGSHCASAPCSQA